MALTLRQQRQLDRARATLARLRAAWERENERWNALSGSFHLGTVGGSGRNVKRLDRKRAISLDRTIDRAVAIRNLTETIQWLEWKEKQPPPPPKEPRPPRIKRGEKPRVTISERQWLLYEWVQWEGERLGWALPFPDATLDEATAIRIPTADDYYRIRATYGVTIYEQRRMKGDDSDPHGRSVIPTGYDIPP